MLSKLPEWHPGTASVCWPKLLNLLVHMKLSAEYYDMTTSILHIVISSPVMVLKAAPARS